VNSIIQTVGVELGGTVAVTAVSIGVFTTVALPCTWVAVPDGVVAEGTTVVTVPVPVLTVAVAEDSAVLVTEGTTPVPVTVALGTLIVPVTVGTIEVPVGGRGVTVLVGELVAVGGVPVTVGVAVLVLVAVPVIVGVSV
jgi:hypothetical protein